MNRYKKLYNLFEFQESSANKIRMDETHEDHTEYFNERYWHGWEAAIRYAKDRLKDHMEYPKIIL